MKIAVGPLGSNGFLLLGKRSQAIEGDERTFDQRTRPMSEKVGIIVWCLLELILSQQCRSFLFVVNLSVGTRGRQAITSCSSLRSIH